MYGIRINFNDGKENAVQDVCFDFGVRETYYLQAGSIVDLDLYGKAELASFTAKVIIDFLLDGSKESIKNEETGYVFQRDDWLEVLIEIEQRCSTEDIEPGMFINRADKLPYYRNLLFEIVHYTPSVHSLVMMPYS